MGRHLQTEERGRVGCEEFRGSEPLKDAFPELFAISSQQLVSVGNAGSWRRDQWTWDLTWKRQLNSNEEESLHSLETILVDVHLVAESHDRCAIIASSRRRKKTFPRLSIKLSTYVGPGSWER
ncbi:hypothetical protein glysoja_033769 [Glycine soja]|uniref:Uncharacterized protein n=1 Tax=Glycine soja TaxID=3848 RepID=A0A0B2QFV9_GLYSO|nr:hypothetical protein glysoja_033769 [Glycine soja]